VNSIDISNYSQNNVFGIKNALISNRYFYCTARSFMRNLLFNNVIVALFYFVFGYLGQLLAISPGNVTPVWPPSAIALAAIIYWGRRSWAGIFIGAFLVNGQAIFTADVNTMSALVISSVSIGVGSLLQPVFGND